MYPHPNNQFTHFLSLDKCQGQRACLQLLSFTQGEEGEGKEGEKVEIEVDPVWVGVLMLTRELMRGGDNLYYFDKQEIKLVDIGKMNKLIESYCEVRHRIEEMGPVSLDPSLPQKAQTAAFLKRVGIDLSEVEGILCEKEEKGVEVRDEIDLDL